MSKLRRTLLSAVAAFSLCGAGLVAGPVSPALADPYVESPASYVNPIIGTANAGNTHPGAVTPFGMLTWGPDQSANFDGQMRTASPSGYEYSRNFIRGFSLTHVSGAGCTGLSGDIPFMPWTKVIVESPPTGDSLPNLYRSTFSHENEEVSAGRYKVKLDSGVEVDLAASDRSGAGRFTYPENDPAFMLIRTSDSLVGSEDSWIEIDKETNTVFGAVTSGNFCGPFTSDGILQKSYYTVFFTAEFSSEFEETGTWRDDINAPGTTRAFGGTGYERGYPTTGKGAGGWVKFADKEVDVQVGISYVSLENAKENLTAELAPTDTVDEVAEAAFEKWNDQLGKISVSGGTDNELTTFYTALYHSYLHPNLTSDVNGEYKGFDQEIHTISDSQEAQYATFSGWDAYRSQIPLIALVEPDRASDIATSLYNQAVQNGGVWDRWTHNSGDIHVMVGDPSPTALASILSFGGNNFPVQEAFDSLAKAAREPTEKDKSRRGWNVAVEGQRPSLDMFLEYGYYPEGCNAWGCPNETLEMATSDYALSVIADYVEDEAAQAEFVKRSQSWQKQFNPHATEDGGYFQRRLADGSWVTPFDPSKAHGFVEGTAAVYVWMVQHNVAGLADAMGGKERAIERLDAHFHDNNGDWRLTGSWDNNIYANMDNEPSVATPWLYNYMGVPSKTQDTVRETIKQLWLTGPGKAGDSGADRIPGNDDLGAMSSWLAFASMGIYPQIPSRAELTVAAPLFPEVVIHRSNGKDLSIKAPGADVDTKYIQSMKVNGESTTKTFLDPSILADNAVVEFEVGKSPNEQWGTGPEDAPPSFREGEVSHVLTVAPQKLDAAAGGLTSEVNIIAQKLHPSDSLKVTYVVEAPEQLVPSSVTGELEDTDQPGRSMATLKFRADEEAENGEYQAKITVSSDEGVIGSYMVNVNVASRYAITAGTSFEPGEPQAPDSESLNGEGISGYCCGITGFESKVQSGEDGAVTGAYGVVYSGKASEKDAEGRNYILKDVNVPIRGGDEFTYTIKPDMVGHPNLGVGSMSASLKIAMDIIYSDGSKLSDSAPVASNGAVLSPTEQSKVLEGGKWNTVSVIVPDDDDGKIIKHIVLWVLAEDGYANGTDGGSFRGWLDDVYVKTPVAPLIVEPAGGESIDVGQVVDKVWAKFRGGSGTKASDYSAKITWTDTGESEDVEIRQGEDGYEVVASHKFETAGEFEAKIVVSDGTVESSAEVPIIVNEEIIDPDPDPDPGTDPDPDPGTAPRPGTPGKPTLKFERHGGADRYGTSHEVNKAHYVAGTPLLIATGGTFPDALTAGSAAAKVGGSLALVGPNGFSSEALALFKAKVPSAVYIAGGEQSVSAAAVAQIRKAVGPSVKVERVAGADRYGTSRAIAKKFFAESKTALVATGENFPDALSASAAGGILDAPVILVKGKGALDADTTAILRSMKSLAETHVVGGVASVNRGIEKSLAKISKISRFSGATRYDTNMKLNAHLDAKAGEVNDIWLVSGEVFPDAVVAGAHAGKEASRLYLVQRDCVGKWVSDAANAESISKLRTVHLAGGKATLSDSVMKLNTCS